MSISCSSSEPCFGPMFGIVLADYFILRKGAIDIEDLYRPAGQYWFKGGLNPVPSSLGHRIRDLPGVFTDVDGASIEDQGLLSLALGSSLPEHDIGWFHLLAPKEVNLGSQNTEGDF